MYINVESVEIETNYGKKNQTNSHGRDRGASRKYLGSWTCSEEKDIKVRTAVAWQSLNKVNNIWKSDFAEKKRQKLFRATKETILLYRSGTRSLTKKEASVELIQECCKWW